ncbi:glycoside hydrolase family 13 protein [Neolewinella antarctica]|uniref:Glycosidase n=1 Tax=Neolewinella antarctica TaxID=442734 RepID=A0ABX0X794_9BACT|nr:glycoside hydrolase family 13 protein [Neolewinella antarctica]NJC25012.1 glycosidase [Neolewinella antarctica]
MLRVNTLLAVFTVLLVSPLIAQQPSVFDDDPMQHLPIGTEFSEYVIRSPTGLENVVERVEPMNWWVDMVAPRVEILVYARNVADYDRALVSYPGVAVEYVRRLANPNYLFVGLHIAPGTLPGSFPIQLGTRDLAQVTSGETRTDKTQKTIEYRLDAHPRTTWTDRQPLSSRDLIYLIMPDRFANGDPTNDKIYAATDTLVNRDKFLFRHGGDLQGVIDHLDYLEDLGVTALWLNPVLENDQPYASYHGYAVSDHYRIDPRLGTNAQYKELVNLAHARGIKVVMDVIFNHCGDQHYQIRDIPSADWIHQWPTYTKSNFRAATIFDPYASEIDKRQMLDGWFDNHMPDLNQENEHLANYLINNSIWWTLYSGQDAFRVDTYTYPDTKFMANWNRRLREEIPHVGIFGETWVNQIGVQAWFVGGDKLSQAIDTKLPAVTDFQTYFAIHEAIAEEPSWTGGVTRLYYTLSQDYLYPDPSKNVIFLDNHDISRLYTTFAGDLTKMKSAMALLLTLRGTPSIYYGTEALLEGSGGAFGEGGRVDFPGGFPGDDTDLFSDTNRNGAQREYFNYVRALANYRKNSEALTVGELTQFVPRDGVYVYFRRAGSETVMIILNGNSSARTLADLSDYVKITGGFTKGKELGNSEAAVQLTDIRLAPKQARVFILEH